MTKLGYPRTVHLSRVFAVAAPTVGALFFRAKSAVRVKSEHNGSTSKRLDVGNPTLEISPSISRITTRNSGWPQPISVPSLQARHEAVERAGRRALPVAQRHRHADPCGVDALPGGTRRPAPGRHRRRDRRDPPARARIARPRPDGRDARARVAPGRAPEARFSRRLRPLRMGAPTVERALPALLSSA